MSNSTNRLLWMTRIREVFKRLVASKSSVLTLQPRRLTKKKECNVKERWGTHEEGGLYKELQIPSLPPKSPRSGVTFHLRIVYRNQIF